MKKNTIIKLVFVISIIVLISALALIFITKKNDVNYIYTNLYFFDVADKRLKKEERKIPKGNNEEVVDNLIKEFWKGGKKTNANGTTLDITVISSTKIDNDGLFMIDFTKKYFELTSYEELILRSSLLWTLTELDFVSGINFTVEGENIFNTIFTRENLFISHSVSPGKDTVYQEVVLYYPDIKNKILVPVSLNMDINIKNSGKDILNQLITGEVPDVEGISKPFTDGTLINKIEKQGSVCYIDVNSEFLTAVSQDPEIEKLQIYSIVNSLGLPNLKILSAKEVQFFYNNKKIKKEEYNGALDLSQSLKFSEDLLSAEEK